MRSKVPLLPGRRTRTSRLTRRILVGVFVLIVVLVGFMGYMIYYSLGDGTGLFPSEPTSPRTPGGRPQDTAPPTPEKKATDAETADALPYSESLDELLQLLRLFTATRGVVVNTSLLGALHSPAGAGGDTKTHDITEEMQLPGLGTLRGQDGGADAGIGHRPSWVLDNPSVIQTEQEDYVERFIAPVQPDATLSPLNVLRSFYDPQSPRSLHYLAAATEKSMNDNGYAKYIQRSVNFYDPAHAARRGYGAEGSIFVAVPFTLRDITADMVDAITARASAPLSNTTAEVAALRNPLDGADDVAGTLDSDGFREIHRTAVRCAVTVESLFRQAHRGIGVTVGTIDVVVVSGLSTTEEADLATPPDVRRPVTLEDRKKLSASRTRRYDRITCEPPSFRSGWSDASYGFSWKDNVRQRRVLVPLTQLTSAATTPAGSTLPRFAAEAQVGRYAVLQLYRGESYVFLLSAGALALPDWDLKLRLLYLRTPQHQRAVLSSRPTPAVMPQSVAAAMVKTWTLQPYLLFTSLAEAAAAPDAAHGAGHVAMVPELDWTGRRLLKAFPENVAAWLTEARGEAALALWLVTPRWLWPTLVSVHREWQALSTGDAPSTPLLKPTLREIFDEAVVKAVLGEGGAAPAPLDLSAVTVVDAGTGKARLSGVGTETRTAQPVLTAGLTESEVYKIVFLAEKRPPLPNEPITDMSKLATDNASALATTTMMGTAGTELAVDGGMVTCGTAGSPLSYYAASESALVKRAFEYCWLQHHRVALRALAERLAHASSAVTLLTGASSKTEQTGAVKCGSNARRFPWYETQVLSSANASRCLMDMRYLDPSETPLLDGEASTTTTATSSETWFTSPKNVGHLRGSSAPSKRLGTAIDVNADGAVGANVSSPVPTAAAFTTPYVLQSVASADLLFAPAEAFFNIAPQDRLRTRVHAVTEQLRSRRAAATGGAATNASAHAETPEAVELDPSLHYLDGGAVDLYLTTALWTRGWNVFGLTESVVGGEALSEASVAPAADDAGQCGVGGETAPQRAEMQAAQSFAEEKLWAQFAAHRATETPFGPVYASAVGGTAAKACFPLRRTLTEYEAFAQMKLDDVRVK